MDNDIAIDEAIVPLQAVFNSTHHCFIRECYFTTDHCVHEFVDDSGETVLGDVNSPHNARLVVVFPWNPDDSGVEFLFLNVKSFSINTLEEITFRYEYDMHGGHSVRFSNGEFGQECWIRAESVLVRFLGKSYRGPELLAGFELPTTDAYEAEKLDACRRQCDKCRNVWEENPKIVFSRCPRCKELTRMIADGDVTT